MRPNREKLRRWRAPLWLLGAGACLTAIGWIVERTGWLTVPTGSGRMRRLVYETVAGAPTQLGVLAVACACVWGLARFRRPSPSSRGRARPAFAALTAFVAVVLFFVTGELALRVVFADGENFARHMGPIVHRWERDFRRNRYEGSRGPEIADDVPAGAPRLVVQGDSITWGQGVRHEHELFTSLVLECLRETEPRLQMAVLAAPGRDIPQHAAQLEKHGPSLRPDALVYLWFVNDLEVDQSRRPAPRGLVWRSLFFHDVLREYSYFWFFLDDRLASIWPTGDVSYSDYLRHSFETDTPEWREFEMWFERWATRARNLTPRVLVALYPFDPGRFRHRAIHERVAALSARHGLETLDLIRAVPELAGAAKALRASRFDPHPNATAHALIAPAIAERVARMWPELGRPQAPGDAALPPDPPRR